MQHDIAAAARKLRARPGDPVAELELYDACMQSRPWIGAHYPTLARDADEIVHDAFLALWRFCSRREPANPAGLWRVILSRVCGSYLRVAHRRREVLARRKIRDERFAPEPSPEQAAIERERRAAVIAAIGEVERAEHRDLLLRLLDGELPREGRARLGLSTNCYAVAAYRARRAAARVATIRAAYYDARRPNRANND